MKLNASVIGRNLKIQRFQAKLTQEQLAEALGVTSQQVSNWEAGKSLIGLKRLVELSHLFQVDINVLLGPEYSISTEQSLNAELAATVAGLPREAISLCVDLCRVVSVRYKNSEKCNEQADGQNA